MRRLYALLICLFLLIGVNAQYVNIPDINFRNFLQANYPGCVNSSGQLDTTCSVLLTVDSLGFGGEMGVYCDYYHDMEGIQYFKNLKKFVLNNTCLQNCPLPPSVEYISAQWSRGFTLPPFLKLLDVSFSGWLGNGTLPSSLEVLIAQNSGITSLPALPASLKVLDVANTVPSGSPNTVRQLPILPTGLRYLNCMNNFITTMPQLPPALTYLNCSGNVDFVNNVSLTTLPALPPLLDTLDCSNELSQMPALPTGITYLRFGGGTMTGLPAFPPGLKTLIIENAPQLASLPALPATIDYLLCNNTKVASIASLPAALKTLIFTRDSMLTSIPAIPAGVDYINCSFNRLASFPALPAALKYLDCNGNRLTSLPALPAGLTYLNTAENSLTALPALPSTLSWLFVNNNQLTSLPPMSHTSVYYFSCGYNNLTTIPALPAVLNGLYCEHNRLTSLPALPFELDTLMCDNNNITALPALNGQLSILMCHNNQLSELPELTGSLYGITCYGNNIYCLPRLPQTSCPLQIIVDTAKVRCIPNTIPMGIIQDYRQGTGLDVCGSGLYYWVDLPICNPTNNSGNCHAYPVISGTAFYDINSNGIKDNNELYKQNLSVRLQNNETTFTNSNGYFEIAAVGTGNNTITLGAVRFYNVVPPSSLYNFTSFDTTVAKEYALRPAVTKDSVSISVVPLYWAARPGFTYPYRVLYENIGTTIINHALQFAYDSSKLVYDSASNPLAVNTGNSIILASNNFVPGQRGMLDVYFRVKTTAPLNSPLLAKAAITSGSSVWTDSSYTEINGAYDPNDKHATPQLSPSQVAAGSFINYTIRFQNTGTDTAFTVVVTDTLSSLLQLNTLQMIATSHTCKTTVKGNIVYFEFRDILLPDSNVNELKSHGFVSFRIKPLGNVAVNTNIPNKAAIYFDYNSPVITNTAITQIKNPVLPVPLRLLTFTAMWQNNNRATISWNTANEINVRQYNIEQSLNGSSFTSIGAEPAKGRQYNSYNKSIAVSNSEAIYFRLKMIDMDGLFSYSPVVVLRKNKTKAGFSILNNPATNALNIDVQDGTLQHTAAAIINAQGAVVKSFIIKQGIQTIDIKGMTAGVYYLRTLNGSSRVLIR